MPEPAFPCERDRDRHTPLSSHADLPVRGDGPNLCPRPGGGDKFLQKGSWSVSGGPRRAARPAAKPAS